VFLKYFLLVFFCLSFLPSCFFKKKEKELLINGAGASFPYILYSKWIKEYKKEKKDVKINYQSIGSGGGIRQFLSGTLDFGGTDIPVSSEEEKNQKKIVHIPTTLGAVAITYNLASLKNQTIKLTGELLADIFRGKVKYWNDSKIQEINREISFPSKKILLVYRADGSGTTSFFTEFLSLKSPVFLKEVGKGKSVPWPFGLGAKGNEGVMGLVRKLEGAISYIGLSYAISQNLPRVAIKNKDGFFVQPSLSSLQFTAMQALKDKEAYTESLIDKKGEESYPISGYTFFILSKLPEPKGSALLDFVKWSLTKGQKFSESLHFIPLPPPVRWEAIKKLSSLKN